MKLQVKYFGMMTDLTNTDQEVLELQTPISIQSLKKTLEEKHNALKGILFQIAIDQEIINQEDHQIQKDAEIALLPAFAGG